MKRSAFKPRAPQREARDPDRLRTMPTVTPGAFRAPQPVAKGMKQSDLLTFPLCCTRVSIPGCHQDYDQYRLFPRAAAMTVGRAWAADTQRRIHAMGAWPKKFPAINFEVQGGAR